MKNEARRRLTLGQLSRLTVTAIAWIVLTQATFASEHPGNVFVAGEDVHVAVPKTWAGWRAVDIDGNEVGQGSAGEGSVNLGKLPTGYFEIREKDGTARITAAVITPSKNSENTPIAIDAAVSWFYPEAEKIKDACALCRLAGVKWVRDRLSWPELEPAKGKMADETRYERAMQIQHDAQLKILQVNHASPPWASKNGAHFPDDLRDVYAFYKELAKRWNGLADAIEPWNEPDIELFGGHTGSEIASFQKAAYLGLKAGDSKLPVCQAVFAIDRQETLDDFGANEVYPYFDRYDLHHYVGLPAYARAYARHRAVSGGRPLWTTEFNLMVNWADEKTKEPTDEDLRIQAYRVSKVFATALHEGSEKAFYFILGDYVERQLQYGLVHQDLTPRPAYVAFAAVGRLLDGAVPIGRVDLGNEKLMGYVFKTIINGTEQETLVAWSETNPTAVNTRSAKQMYDYLGRELPHSGNVELTRAPVFMVMPRGGSKDLTITSPPAKVKWLDGKACPVVLQLLGKGDATQSALVLDESKQLRLVAYNFGDTTAHGKLSIEGATGTDNEIEITPGGREERTLIAIGPGPVTVRLDLGSEGRPIVSGRVTTTPTPPKASP